MKKIAVLATLLLSVFLSNAQHQWTLIDCIEYANLHNNQIKQAQLEIKQADVNKESSWANVFPNLNLGTGYFWTFGKSIDPITNVRVDGSRQTSSLTLSSNWVIFNGLQNYKNIEKSNIDYMASMYNLEAMKNDIALQVTSQYLQVLLNKEVKTIAEQQYDISNKLVLRTDQLYKAGTVAKGELLQVQARIASDEQSVVSAENNIKLGLLQLSQLLQLDSVPDFDIETPELNLPDAYLMGISADEIYRKALSIQPNIKSAELGVESAENSVAISKGAAYPQLSVQAQINTNYANTVLQGTGTSTIYTPNYYYSDPTNPNSNIVVVPQANTVPLGLENKPFTNQYTDNLNQYVGLNLSIPIFNNYRVRSSVRNSRIQLESASLNLTNQKLQFKQTIEKAHADANASFKAFKAAEKSTEANQENWDYAQKLKAEGAMNQYDYENARFQYLQSVSSMLQAKYDYIFKIKVLEFYLNNKVTLN